MENRAGAEGKLMHRVELGNVKQCIGCRAVGVPESGYTIYACDACLGKLAAMILSGKLVDPPATGLVS